MIKPEDEKSTLYTRLFYAAATLVIILLGRGIYYILDKADVNYAHLIAIVIALSIAVLADAGLKKHIKKTR